MGKGLDYDELFPGRFIKAGDLKGRDVNLTIRGVRIEELPQDRGGERAKGIISFEGTKKEWVLNRTNGEALKAMWGRDTGDWIGKRVTLYPAQFNGDLAIRVKGSPDLAADITFELKLPRKRPQQTTLKATGGKKNGKQSSHPQKPDPEPPNEETAAAAEAYLDSQGSGSSEEERIEF